MALGGFATIGSVTKEPSVSGDIVTRPVQLLSAAEQTRRYVSNKCDGIFKFFKDFFKRNLFKSTRSPPSHMSCGGAIWHAAFLPPMSPTQPQCPQTPRAVSFGLFPPHCPQPWLRGGVQGNTGAVGAGAADISVGPRLCQRVGGFAVVPTNRRAKAVLQTGKGGFFSPSKYYRGLRAQCRQPPR